jgi:hypothetical protein
VTETGTTTRATARKSGATVRLRDDGHVAPSRAEALTGAPPPILPYIQAAKATQPGLEQMTLDDDALTGEE